VIGIKSRIRDLVAHLLKIGRIRTIGETGLSMTPNLMIRMTAMSNLILMVRLILMINLIDLISLSLVVMKMRVIDLKMVVVMNRRTMILATPGR
jgi:hypothetical protein